jgi:regulator of replication initiation timing
MNLSFENKIALIENKIVVLKNNYEQATDAISEYKSENKALKLEIENLKEQLKDFQNQEKIAKIAQTILSRNEDPTELKTKIGEYIKELDKCIAHLSN